MIIKRLNKDDYAGKEFKVCYQTNGYYDIVPDKLGFKIQYVPFETCVSRSFIDEFFGEWRCCQRCLPWQGRLLRQRPF